MINVFAHTAPVWNETLDILKDNDNVDEEFTINIYSSIIEYGDEIEQWNKEKALQAAQKTSNYLEKMKKLEAIEKQKEEKELDSMLHEIENI